MPNKSIKINVEGKFVLSEEELKSMYVSYYLSANNASVPIRIRKVYQTMLQQIYQQGKEQGLDMVALHIMASEYTENQEKMQAAVKKFVDKQK